MLAMKLLLAGMGDRAAENMLRALMQNAAGEHEAERWQARYDDVPRAVSTARAKIDEAASRLIMPIDLWAKLTPPQLPRGLLPDLIERFVFDQGASMGCDPAGLVASALTVCAAAIPDRIKIQVKQHDPSWTEFGANMGRKHWGAVHEKDAHAHSGRASACADRS